MIHCPRCGGIFRKVLVMIDAGTCESMLCIYCGNCEDPVILENRTPERREYWKKRASWEQAEPLSREERIVQQYEPEAIKLNL